MASTSVPTRCIDVRSVLGSKIPSESHLPMQQGHDAILSSLAQLVELRLQLRQGPRHPRHRGRRGWRHEGSSESSEKWPNFIHRLVGVCMANWLLLELPVGSSICNMRRKGRICSSPQVVGTTTSLFACRFSNVTPLLSRWPLTDIGSSM